MIDANTNTNTNTLTPPSATDAKLIPIAAIERDTINLRDAQTDHKEWENFVNSIKAMGITTPISVRPHPTDSNKYILLDGTQRLQGATEAGLKVIPASIVTNLKTSDDVFRWQIVANAHSIATKPTQYAEMISRVLAHNPSLTLADVAGWLKKSSAWVSNILRLKTLTDEAKELVESGKIKTSNAIALSKLPKEEMEHFLDQAENLGSVEFATIVNDHLAELRKLRSGDKTTGFEARSKIRDKDEIEAQRNEYYEELDIDNRTAEELDELYSNNQEPFNLGFFMALTWTLSLDKDTVEAAKLEYENRVAERERKKAEKARLREEEKAAKEGKSADDVLPIGMEV